MTIRQNRAEKEQEDECGVQLPFMFHCEPPSAMASGEETRHADDAAAHGLITLQQLNAEQQSPVGRLGGRQHTLFGLKKIAEGAEKAMQAGRVGFPLFDSDKVHSSVLEELEEKFGYTIETNWDPHAIFIMARPRPVENYAKVASACIRHAAQNGLGRDLLLHEWGASPAEEAAIARALSENGFAVSQLDTLQYTIGTSLQSAAERGQVTGNPRFIVHVPDMRNSALRALDEALEAVRARLPSGEQLLASSKNHDRIKD